MWEDNRGWTFSLDETLLWIMGLYFVFQFKVKTSWCICFLLTHSFSLHNMLIDGLEWCGLLWCFYQLFRLSFWRHPFTAEDLLLSKWCNAKFLQICSSEEINSSTTFWMAWGWKFSANFLFWMIYSFKQPSRT